MMEISGMSQNGFRAPTGSIPCFLSKIQLLKSRAEIFLFPKCAPISPTPDRPPHAVPPRLLLMPRTKIMQIFSRYEHYGGEEGSVYRIGDAMQDEWDVEYFLAS